MKVDALFSIKVENIGVDWKYTCLRNPTSPSIIKEMKTKTLYMYYSALL